MKRLYIPKERCCRLLFWKADYVNYLCFVCLRVIFSEAVYHAVTLYVTQMISIVGHLSFG